MYCGPYGRYAIGNSEISLQGAELSPAAHLRLKQPAMSPAGGMVTRHCL